MYIYKENKFSSDEKITYNFSLKECQNNINILESLIEYIKNIENSLKELMQQNINLKNQIQEKEAIIIDFDKENEIFLKLFSQGRIHIENVKKIINNFKNSINEGSTGFTYGNGDNKEIGTNKNKNDFSNEIKEIKKYYEGKIELMDKKIKISEILENLYAKQIDGLKKKLNKNVSNELKNIDN